MAKTAVIQARIDPKVKMKAQKVLDALQISMSEAISVYLNQVALQKAIPFEIRIPNRTTISSLQEAERGKNLKSTPSVDSLFEELSK